MSTDTLPDETEVDLNEIDLPEDLDEYFKAYEAAAVGSRTPEPGSYNVRMPDAIPDSAFQVKVDKQSGKRFLSVTLDNGQKGEAGQGLGLIGPDGTIIHEARFVRVDTRRNAKLAKVDGKWGPTGQIENASSIDDVLINFNGGPLSAEQFPRSLEDYKTAIRQLLGQVSPSPFYLTWEGDAKGQTAYKDRFLKAKAFKGEGGKGWVAFVERTAEKQFTQKRKGEQVTIEAGTEYRVYPQLALGRRGAAPKK